MPAPLVTTHPHRTSARTSPPAIVDPDTFAEKKQIVEAAIALRQNPEAALTTRAVAETADVPPETVVGYVDDIEELPSLFYDLVGPQYHLLAAATTGREDFTFEERLASFYYILLDTLGEQRAYVQATFETRARTRSSFRADVRAILRTLLTGEAVPGTNQLVTGLWPVHEVLTTVTLAVVRHWLHDETENQAATTALVDKLVAFVAELVTFRGVSRGADLAWYLVQNDTLGLGRLPLVGRWFRR